MQSNPVLNVEPATQCQTKEGSKAHERNNSIHNGIHWNRRRLLVNLSARAEARKKKKKKKKKKKENHE